MNVVVAYYIGSTGWFIVRIRVMAEKQLHISIPKPFCTGDISEWFFKFEICCKVNKWDDETKAAKLPNLLESKVCFIRRFSQRKLWPGKALLVFYHDLKKLLNLVMPILETAGQKQLLLHQLIAGLLC